MSKLKVDTLSNVNLDAGPSLVKGATIPVGKTLNVLGNISVSGIITASSFVGDGSNLSNIGGTPTSISQVSAQAMLFGNYYRA